MRIIPRFEAVWVDLRDYREFTEDVFDSNGAKTGQRPAFRKAAPGETGGKQWFDEDDKVLLHPLSLARQEAFNAKLAVCRICNGSGTSSDGRALCPKCHGNSPRLSDAKGRVLFVSEFVEGWELKDARGAVIPFDDAHKTSIANESPIVLTFMAAALDLAQAIEETTRGN